MPLTFQLYPHSLAGLAQSLMDNLPIVEDRALAEHDVAGEMQLIGPFPSFYVDPREFLTSGASAAEQTGWRGLIERDDHAVALVDITLSQIGTPNFAWRGTEAAEAFQKCLVMAANAQLDDSYEARWLSMADIYVTALWLAGPDSLFIPTRLGGPRPTDGGVVKLQDLQAVVEQLVNAASAPGPTDDNVMADQVDKSPRSGLPPG